jgi:hypothetical protein
LWSYAGSGLRTGYFRGNIVPRPGRQDMARAPGSGGEAPSPAAAGFSRFLRPEVAVVSVVFARADLHFNEGLRVKCKRAPP